MAPPLRLALLWHMHQPMYRVGDEVILPWTRLHATKDYHEMIRILEPYPGMHCTFNFVPSLLLQLRGYGQEGWNDELLTLQRSQPETLSESQVERLLYYARLLPTRRMVDPYPRFSTLLGQHPKDLAVDDVRDLQVLYSLSWLGEDEREDPIVQGMLRRGTSFSSQERSLLHAKEDRIAERLLESIGSAGRTGQIELSTTPFYHPILPLLLDLEDGVRAEPGISLPSTSTGWKEDVLHQLEGGREFHKRILGEVPRGCWPSEGSVSTKSLRAIASAGFDWTASDEEILRKTRGSDSHRLDHAFPWRFRHDGQELVLFFRDHDLSDRIGFNYSSMDTMEAVRDFVGGVLERRDGIVAELGEDALEEAVLPVILDGENCWEHYEKNGAPFLNLLYATLVNEELIQPVTFSEAVDSLETSPERTLSSIEPGSWIGGNFRIWIGGSEENRAWELLAETRRALMSQRDVVPESEFLRAYEEFLIAQGSDWFWWFGEENNSANDMDFDLLFRERLTSVYKLVSLVPPGSLGRPIRHPAASDGNRMSTGTMHRAEIDPTTD